MILLLDSEADLWDRGRNKLSFVISNLLGQPVQVLLRIDLSHGIDRNSAQHKNFLSVVSSSNEESSWSVSVFGNLVDDHWGAQNLVASNCAQIRVVFDKVKFIIHLQRASLQNEEVLGSVVMKTDQACWLGNAPFTVKPSPTLYRALCCSPLPAIS